MRIVLIKMGLAEAFVFVVTMSIYRDPLIGIGLTIMVGLIVGLPADKILYEQEMLMPLEKGSIAHPDA